MTGRGSKERGNDLMAHWLVEFIISVLIYLTDFPIRFCVKTYWQF